MLCVALVFFNKAHLNLKVQKRKTDRQNNRYECVLFSCLSVVLAVMITKMFLFFFVKICLCFACVCVCACTCRENNTQPGSTGLLPSIERVVVDYVLPCPQTQKREKHTQTQGLAFSYGLRITAHTQTLPFACYLAKELQLLL